MPSQLRSAGNRRPEPPTRLLLLVALGQAQSRVLLPALEQTSEDETMGFPLKAHQTGTTGMLTAITTHMIDPTLTSHLLLHLIRM